MFSTFVLTIPVHVKDMEQFSFKVKGEIVFQFPLEHKEPVGSIIFTMTHSGVNGKS